MLYIVNKITNYFISFLIDGRKRSVKDVLFEIGDPDCIVRILTKDNHPPPIPPIFFIHLTLVQIISLLPPLYEPSVLISRVIRWRLLKIHAQGAEPLLDFLTTPFLHSEVDV